MYKNTRGFKYFNSQVSNYLKYSILNFITNNIIYVTGCY